MVKGALDGSGDVSTREYTEAERNLNRFIRENYPEWACKPV
jgi:sulfate adenylyltransferase subunit 1